MVAATGEKDKVLWKVFERTGSIEAFLLYQEARKIGPLPKRQKSIKFVGSKSPTQRKKF